MGYRVMATLFFALITTFLIGNWEPSSLIVSVLVGGIVSWMSVSKGRVKWESLPSALVALVRLVFTLVVDMVKCAINVGRIVLSPSLPINPGIVKISSHTKVKVEQAISAHMLTITPGEMVVGVINDDLIIHFLDIKLDIKTLEKYQVERIKLLRKLTAPFLMREDLNHE